MAKRVQQYESDAILVTFDPNVCIHAGVCLRSLPTVFDVRHERWIRLEHADTADVADAIRQCPSGALQYRFKDPGAPGPGGGQTRMRGVPEDETGPR